MSSWTTRIAPEAVSRAVRAALSEGRLSSDAPSLLFHDLDLLHTRLASLRAAFPPGTLHAVAVKANPLVGVLHHVVAAGAGLEAASMEEVALALAAGAAPAAIVYDSPCKSWPDLFRALTLGVHLNADNVEELDRIDRLRAQVSDHGVIGLRVNPAVGEGSIAATSTVGRGSKFGVNAEDVDAIAAIYATRPWLTGLHVHVGSQGCPVPLLVAGVSQARALVDAIHERLDRTQITTLDIGGGLPTTYVESQPGPGLEAYVEALEAESPDVLDGSLQLVTEFGRAIHANCGFAVSRVEYVKELATGPLAVIHLGADLLMRTAYRPDDWPHELLVLNPDGTQKTEASTRSWAVGGPLCFSGDIIARDRTLPELAPGDLIVVRDTGAYTLGMWSRHCSRGIPEVLAVSAGKLAVLRQRETVEDLVRFWSP